MGSLENFVNSVTTLTARGSFTELLKGLGRSTDLLYKHLSHLDNILATLQPSIHTLGVLAVLKVRLQYVSHADSDIDTLHATVADFFNVGSVQQMAMAPEMVSELCGIYTRLLIAGKCPMRGLDVIRTALVKTRESPHHLTSLHTYLIHLCLASKCFKPALEFLDADPKDISKEGGGYDVEHFLLYHYYGGMIYAALKNFSRAQYFFQVCISTPAHAVSLIMVEAFKKYILVSLIVEGKVGNVPKYVSMIFNRLVKPLSHPYLKLSSAYATNNPEKLNAVVAKNEEHFARDNNMGLVKQVTHSLYKMNIKRLTQTFLTLSLTDVANRVHLSSPQEAQKYILNMIEDGEIHACINQRDGMVAFHDNPEKFDNPLMFSRMDKMIERIFEVEAQFSAMEEEIMLSPQYIHQSSSNAGEEDASLGRWPRRTSQTSANNSLPPI